MSNCLWAKLFHINSFYHYKEIHYKTSRLIVFEQLEVFPRHYFFMFHFSINNETFSLRYFIKKKVKNLNMQFFCCLTLTFDPYVILTGKGQLLNLKWFDGSTK